MAGEVLLRKGHIERDCLRRVSMASTDTSDLLEWKRDVLKGVFV